MEQEKTAVKKRLTLFVTLTFVITWIVFLLTPLCGLTYGKGVSIIILAAAMFVPAYITGLIGGLSFIVLAVVLLIKAGNKLSNVE